MRMEGWSVVMFWLNLLAWFGFAVPIGVRHGCAIDVLWCGRDCDCV